MNALNELMARFNKLRQRERLLAAVAVAAILYFIVDITMLKTQQEKIKDLQKQDEAHKMELASVNAALIEAEKKAVAVSEQASKDAIAIEGFKKQIAEADALLEQADATTSQVGALLKKLLDANPGMTLVSLKTLPTAVFYSPETKVGKDGKAAEPVEVQRIIYRHGVEVSVKGDYLALLSYMENLQKYSKRLFWSEAKLDVSIYPDAVLKLVIYSLSDQPSPSLR